LFGLILGILLVTRASLVRERVQEAHRVAILVTAVSVTISSIALLGLEFGQHVLFFAVLFPVLISAWMGERYVEQVARVGWPRPTQALAWSIVAVVVSFFVMTQDVIVDSLMFTPLTWPLLILVNWVLGTRVRFRLTERFRFGGVRQYALADRALEGDFADDILTMPVRNREYISKYNPPDLLARLGKDAVKSLLVPQGIPMARTDFTLREKKDIDGFGAWLASHDRFVLKPASGYGGEGILLVNGRVDGSYDTNFGRWSRAAIEAHAFSIIEGEYHAGQQDSALVEEYLVQYEGLREIAPIGLSDFRVICFLGFPVMGMLRIPTKASGGKANLHLGAIAAGVRLSTGEILHAVVRGQPQAVHPDTEEPLIGRVVPFWEEILSIASEAQRLTGLGFAGVDVALDAVRGPVVMEVNRRPGLEIQIANAAGLLRRLRAVEALPAAWQQLPVEERLRVAREFDERHWGLGAADRPQGSR
jgi:alpha-L-glutamate ligase-like protein